MPDKALEAYSRALTIAPTFEHSVVGRGLALAALGRYDEALERPSPDFRVQAYVLSRVGRYREAAEVLAKGISADDDAEIGASALLTSAWMLIEQKQYARALEKVREAEKVLADRTNHSLLMLADLMGGVAEIRAGSIGNATARLAAQKARYTSAVPVESNWISALEGEIALAQGRYNEAVTSFRGGSTESVDDSRARCDNRLRDKPADARRARARRDWRAGIVRRPSKSTGVRRMSVPGAARLRCWNRGTSFSWRVFSTRTATRPARASSTSGF